MKRRKAEKEKSTKCEKISRRKSSLNKEYTELIEKLKSLKRYEGKRGESNPTRKLYREHLEMKKALKDTMMKEGLHKGTVKHFMLEQIKKEYGMSCEDIKKEKKNNESTKDAIIRLFLSLTQPSPSE
ncbi:MAG: hypothetical protein OXF42_01255 [Candidatus Dadabacteria bacterium]|nr:hypothetical protein [Candidatus Dadabacteria bacterium]